MDEKVFAEIAEVEMARIEAALDAAGLDYDVRPGGILEAECEDGSRMVINRHVAAREIWVAAKSGGFHFHWDGADWRDTRDGETLDARLSRLMRAR
ncbi:MAG: iron donor protein CyaY [Zoogloeaceae bacterium]|jgi:CyaY protein|nr:iron donor protein CyaY [Zoogloeaceae bacterium]